MRRHRHEVHLHLPVRVVEVEARDHRGAVVGEIVPVRATVWREGHDAVAATLDGFEIDPATAAAARAAVATIMGQANNCGGRILKAEYRGRVFVANSTTKKERR